MNTNERLLLSIKKMLYHGLYNNTGKHHEVNTWIDINYDQTEYNNVLIQLTQSDISGFDKVLILDMLEKARRELLSIKHNHLKEFYFDTEERKGIDWDTIIVQKWCEIRLDKYFKNPLFGQQLTL